MRQKERAYAKHTYTMTSQRKNKKESQNMKKDKLELPEQKGKSAKREWSLKDSTGTQWLQKDRRFATKKEIEKIENTPITWNAIGDKLYEAGLSSSSFYTNVHTTLCK